MSGCFALTSEISPQKNQRQYPEAMLQKAVMLQKENQISNILKATAVKGSAAKNQL